MYGNLLPKLFLRIFVYNLNYPDVKTLSDSGSLVENGSFDISSQNSPEISALAQAKFFSMLSTLVTPHIVEVILLSLKEN
jgi:hypothetical protein